MSDDDPVPDIEPEGSSVSNLPEDTAPLVSNANQYFAYALTMVGIFQWKPSSSQIRNC
jgi:hypothetical protein